MVIPKLKARMQNPLNHKKPGLIFVHIPKTGGNSVHHSLSLIYGKDSCKINPVWTTQAAKAVNSLKDAKDKLDKFDLRKAILLYEMAQGTKYISGHIHFDRDIWNAYQHQYSWVTVLRDPVERYISQYFFDVFKPEEHARINQSLEEFIESDRGRFRGQLCVNFLANFSSRDKTDLPTRLEIAKKNLSKFTLVGFLDEIERFTNELENKLNLKIRIPHMNKSPISKPEISTSMKQRIMEICEYDILLYSYAKEVFRNDSDANGRNVNTN